MTPGSKTHVGRRPRVRPSVGLGVAIVVGYTIVLSTIQQISGVPYTEFFDSAQNTWRAPVLSLGIGAVLLLAFVSWARWDMVWRDPERLPVPRWIWLLLGTFTACIVVRGVGIAYDEIDPELLVAVLCLGVLVGLTEELLFRGIFLRCMRSGEMSEGAAALWTGTAFGLFHLPNVFLGTGVSGLVQVLLAGLTGFALYYFRVAAGAIVLAMVMHGMFDVTVFVSPDYAAEWANRVALPLQVATWALGGAAAISLHRKARGYRVTPAGVVPLPGQR